jgi:hypothetical protein
MLALLLAALALQPAPETPDAPPSAPSVEQPPAPAAPPKPAAKPRSGEPRRAPPGVPTPPAPPAQRRGGDVLQGEWPPPSGRRVTLDDTTSLDDALQQISEVGGWNMVLNTGRTGNIQLVLKLRDMPVEEALRAALGGTGLAATRRGDTVVVAPFREAPERRPTLAGFDRPTGKNFTGEFDETEVDDALRQIAAASGLSIVIPPGVSGEVSAVFKASPVEDALRAVLEQAGLTAELRGTIVTVREVEAAGAFPFGPGGPHGIADRARREAERELRRVEREMGDLGDGDLDKGSDRVVNGDVTVRAGELVRDVVAFGGDVRMEPGAQARGVVAIFGRVTLEAGARASEVTAIFGDVEIGPGAQVENDVTSVGGHVRPDPGSMIGGEQTSVGIPAVSGVGALVGSGLFFGRAESPLWIVGQVLAKFAIYFALGLLLLALFPRRVEAVAGSMVANPGRSILVGLLGLVAAPLVALLLVVTIIGIPLVAVLVLLVLAAGALGFTGLAYHIGRSLPAQVQRNAWVLQLAIGTAIVVLVTQIPLLGWLAWITAALLGFGAALRSRFGQHGPPVLPTTAVAPPPQPPPQPSA